MNNYIYANFNGAVPTWLPVAGFLLAIVLLWSLLWKGLALWHAGRKAQPWWFVVLLLVNTVGILEIIYLFFVLRLKFSHLFKK